MLQLDTVTFWNDPPRPDDVPLQRSIALLGAVAGHSEVRYDYGIAESRLVRLSSTTDRGIVTAAQKDALKALYEAGSAFTLTTDLLVPLGQVAVDYQAQFDDAPSFAPATPDGAYFYFDLLVRI